MPHQYHVWTDYHEADAGLLNVVLTDDDDEPIETTADWEARFELLEEPTDETPVFTKRSQDGEITFEPLTEDDIEDFDNIGNTNGDKAIVYITGEAVDGTSDGDTADLLGTGDDRVEQRVYYHATRVWNADGDRATVTTGELEINAPGVQ